jgi:transposase InsO family protein
VSTRSLRKWIREDAPPRPRGRPRTCAPRRLAARRLVAHEWRRQGRSVGIRPLAAALAGRVSGRLVRDLLAEIKRLHGACRRRRETTNRLSVEVRARDVMWSMDGTHLARLQGGEAIEGQVVRETATPKILAVMVGAPADGEDVVALLERVEGERGRLPLVLVTDNGPTYVCEKVETWLASHGVVHLLSLPHTPRHNAWVERTNGELKAETGLGRGVVVSSAKEIRERVETTRCRLNEARLRAQSGFRTAAAADAGLTCWYNVCTRERFLATVCRRLAEALPGLDSERARRKARREAVYASMEEFGLIQRTRGGR